MYGDNENIVQQESHKYTTPEVNEGLLTQKLKNCEMEYDLFCCQDCTKPLWLNFRKHYWSLETIFTFQNTEYEWWQQGKLYGI